MHQIFTRLYSTLRVAALGIMPLLLTACGDDGIDGPVEMPVTEIVTYEGVSNGSSTFTFRKVDDSPLITLTARGLTLDSDAYKEGCRMLLRYVPADGAGAYESCDITPLGGYLVNNGSVATEWKKEYDNWDNDPVYLYSAWRSGEYLNIHVRLTYSTDPRMFCLALDPSTADSEWPELYLVHILPVQTINHDRTYYASFSLSGIWDKRGVKGVKVHIADSNLNKQIFTFTKSSANN